LAFFSTPVPDKLLISNGDSFRCGPCTLWPVYGGDHMRENSRFLGLRISPRPRVHESKHPLGKTKGFCRCVRLRYSLFAARHPSLKPPSQILLWLVVIKRARLPAQYFRRFWSHVDDKHQERRCSRMLEARRSPDDAVSSEADRRAALQLALNSVCSEAAHRNLPEVCPREEASPSAAASS